MIDGEDTPDPMEELAALAAEQDQPEGEVAEGDSEEKEITPLEIELDGKKYQVHPDLKDRFMMDRDYRQKTMSLADERRVFDADREKLKTAEQDLNTRRESQGKYLGKIAQLHLAEQRLADFQKVDWQTFRAQNREQADAAFQDYVLLSQAYSTAAGELRAEYEKEQTTARDDFAKRVSEGQAKAAQMVPNWSEKTKGEIESYATTKGEFTKEEMSSITDPRFYRTLYYASVGQKILELAEARKKQPPTEANPPPKMGARQSAPSSDPSDKDDVKTWMEKRNKQVAAQGPQRKANWNGYARS